MSDPVETVLLDMGGVLIPEAGGYEGAALDADLLSALEAMQVPNPREFVLERADRVRQSYRDLDSSCSQPDLSQVLADTSPTLQHMLLSAFRREAAPPAFAYAADVVAKLAQSHRLGLVSNTVIPGDHHERNLIRAGILKHIECSVWSANFGRRKPDPAMIHHVLARMRVSPRRAIFVGDKLRTDVLAAKRAGLRSVYLRKRGAPLAGEVRPDFTIRGLEALPSLLRQLG